MTPTAPTSLIREMRAIMAEPIEQREWCDDPSNVVSLLEWLHERGEIEWTIEAVAYFLRKPWKWSREFAQMQAERVPASVDTTAVLLGRE